MNSFTLTAVGNLARNPEAVAKGDVTYTRFCLVGNDYAGKDEEGAPREIVTTLWFVAFGPLAGLLVHNTRKGDQLIVEARVRSNNWTDKQGEKQYDHEFVVQGFRYGAPGKIKRAERAARQDDATRRGDERDNGHDNGSAPAMDGDGGTPSAQSNSTPGPSPAANGAAVTQGASSAAAGVGEKSSGSRSARRAAAPPP